MTRENELQKACWAQRLDLRKDPQHALILSQSACWLSQGNYHIHRHALVSVARLEVFEIHNSS